MLTSASARPPNAAWRSAATIALLSTMGIACASGRAPPKVVANSTQHPDKTRTVTMATAAPAAPYAWEKPEPPKEKLDTEGPEVFNKRLWIRAAFLNRVKAKVRQHWQPANVYRRLDPD